MALSPGFGIFLPGWVQAVTLLFLFVSLMLGSGDVFMGIVVAVLAGMGSLISVYGFPSFSGSGVFIVDGVLQVARVFGALLSLGRAGHGVAEHAAPAGHSRSPWRPWSAAIVLVSAIWLGGRLSGVMALGVAVLLLVLLAGLLSEWMPAIQ